MNKRFASSLRLASLWHLSEALQVSFPGTLWVAVMQHVTVKKHYIPMKAFKSMCSRLCHTTPGKKTVDQIIIPN